MKSSEEQEKQTGADEKIDAEKVAKLVECFLNVIEGTLNTVDHIAEVNTETRDGIKVIKASNFRMNIRKLKVRLMEDLERIMTIK